jgi:hypothetical protein
VGCGWGWGWGGGGVGVRGGGGGVLATLEKEARSVRGGGWGVGGGGWVWRYPAHLGDGAVTIFVHASEGGEELLTRRAELLHLVGV